MRQIAGPPLEGSASAEKQDSLTASMSKALHAALAAQANTQTAEDSLWLQATDQGKVKTAYLKLLRQPGRALLLDHLGIPHR